MYIFESRVRYSETDAQGRLTAEKLIDYFQDCSTFQSEENGVGVAEMRARGLAWIIVYWRVEILRMPRLGERIRIGTIPYAMKGGIGLRNFFMETVPGEAGTVKTVTDEAETMETAPGEAGTVKAVPDEAETMETVPGEAGTVKAAPGEAGERLANANSVWTLVDIHTMRPVRIPADVLERYPLGQRLQMQYDARKIRLPAEPGISRPDVTVREYHLDTNRHMNNGQYVRIAAGLLPSGADVRTLRIEYRRQAVLGDRITPVVYSGLSGEETDQADIVCVSLNAKDGKPYAVLEAELQIYHKN